MKKVVKLLAVVLTVLCLAGCRHNPAAETWHLQGYMKPTVFMGGVTRDVIYGNATVAFPFAEASPEKTNITFSQDGKVRFMTCDGEVLEGTYRNEEKLTVTFDNGETGEGTCSRSLLGGAKLEFTFRGVTYYFAPRQQQEFLGKADLIKNLRWENNPYLKNAEVIQGESGFSVAYGNGLQVEITDTTAVYAMHLDENNVLTPLSELREGKCRMNYSVPEDAIVLYYIDPVKTETCRLADIETWIKDIVDSQVAKITVIEEYTGTTTRDETTIKDAAGIKRIMDMLRQTTVVKTPTGQVVLEGKVQTITILVTTKDNTVTSVQTVDKYFIIGGEYWAFDNFLDPETLK